MSSIFERQEEFDILAQDWLAQYQPFRCESFDRQLFKVIIADWLHHRATMTILRVEHDLAEAERDREPPERRDTLLSFLARMSKRCNWYEKAFRSALRMVESLRRARLQQKMMWARYSRLVQDGGFRNLQLGLYMNTKCNLSDERQKSMLDRLAEHLDQFPAIQFHLPPVEPDGERS